MADKGTNPQSVVTPAGLGFATRAWKSEAVPGEFRE